MMVMCPRHHIGGYTAEDRCDAIVGGYFCCSLTLYRFNVHIDDARALKAIRRLGGNTALQSAIDELVGEGKLTWVVGG